MKARAKKQPAFQAATLLAGVLLLLIVFVSAGYIVATDPTDDAVKPELAALTNARQLWKRREPSAYSYAIDRDCFCPEEFLKTYVVTVQGGSTRTELKQDPTMRPPEPLDIPGIFGLLEDALNNADAVSVTYDTDYGFPDNLRIDWQSDVPDDDQAFYIRELRPLP